MSQKIIDALNGLDPENVNHWTADGQPRLDTVRMLAADQSIQRADVDAVAPAFTRTNRVIAEGTAQQAQQAQQATNGGAPAGNEDDDSKSAATPTVAPPQAQQSQVDNPETSPETDTGALSLEQQLEEAEKTATAAKQALNDAQVAWDKARKEEDRLRILLNKTTPAENPAESIQAYLKSQRQSLTDRAARKKMIQESGVNLKELVRSMKAPIDAARERKTGQ